MPQEDELLRAENARLESALAQAIAERDNLDTRYKKLLQEGITELDEQNAARRILKDEHEATQRRLGTALVQLEDLRKELATAILERQRARWSLDYSHECTAVRNRALRDLGKKHGIWSEIACILANGRPMDAKSPNYGAKLNTMRFRAEAAEKERDKAIAELASARDTLTEAMGPVYSAEYAPWYGAIAEGVRRLKSRIETLEILLRTEQGGDT